jgi:hypothetical protein
MGTEKHTNSSIPKPNGQKHEAGTSKDYIAVARGSDLVVIRVVGKGNMLNASALSDFVETQRKAGFKRFVFDMERCHGLDSTFMGVMVGMQSQLNSGSEPKIPAAAPSAPATPAAEILVPINPREAAEALRAELSSASQPQSSAPAEAASGGADGIISAVNVSSNVRDLMGMLGVDKFVKVRGSCDLTQLETTILPEKNIAPDERRRLVLKAHETLVEADKRNLAQFGPFLKTLSSELSKE